MLCLVVKCKKKIPFLQILLQTILFISPNVRKSNVRKSNVRKSIVRKLNVRKSIVRKLNVRKSNVR